MNAWVRCKNPGRSHGPLRYGWLLISLGILVSGTAEAQMRRPLLVTATEPIADHFGRRLTGNHSQPGAVVQILTADQGVFPPNVDGSPDPRNRLLSDGLTAIGNLTSPRDAQPGVFAKTVIDDLPRTGEKIFVRVFNGSSPATSDFYGDSSVFKMKRDSDLFKVDVVQTLSPVDSADNDGDGLVNSWENAIGSDADNADTDGDGMSDGDELRAGTDPFDRNSKFSLSVGSVNNPSRLADSEPAMRLRWASVPGKTYQVEFTADDLGSDPVFRPVGDPITATTTITETIIADGYEGEQGKYRIRLVE